MKNNVSILLADKDNDFLFSFKVILEREGYGKLFLAENEKDLQIHLENHDIQILFLDLNLSQSEGLELLSRIRQINPGLQIIIITADNNIEKAVECMKEGAYDYIIKPIDRNRVLITLDKLLNHLLIKEDVSNLQKAYFTGELKNEKCFSEILTRSPKMRSAFTYIEAISQSPQPVLISGETGVGKELIAKSIYCCAEMEGPYVSINIAGLDEATFNDSLFGHKKGAFTGADHDRDGLLKKAGKGAILLDEIGDLNETLQIKLLRLLNDGTYYPLGADKVEKANVRFIMATNRNLEDRVKNGQFRKDLYYRLISHRITIPPLRERSEDISYLVREMLRQAQKMLKKRVYLSGQAMAVFSDFDYPGNVRELKNIVFDCVANTPENENMSTEYLESRLRGEQSMLESSDLQGNLAGDGPMTLAEIEKEHIKKALKRNRGNQSRAAAELGISRQALNKRIKNNPNLLVNLLK